jgi:RNA polymerase sigma factor (sigma-70 family)
MTPTTVTRPQWYDDKVLAHRPVIAWMAKKLVPTADIDEFIQDVYVLAFYRYSNFNPEYAFTTWLGMLSRNVATERRRARLTKMRTGRLVDMEQMTGVDNMTLSAPATQDIAADLAIVLEALPKDRDGEVWLRRAQGEELAEIGRDMGIGRERARQLGDRGRQRMERRLTIGAMVRRMKSAREAA